MSAHAHLLSACGALPRVRARFPSIAAGAHLRAHNHLHSVSAPPATDSSAQIGIARTPADVQHDRRRGQSDQGVKQNFNPHRCRNQLVPSFLLSALYCLRYALCGVREALKVVAKTDSYNPFWAICTMQAFRVASRTFALVTAFTRLYKIVANMTLMIHNRCACRTAADSIKTTS